MPRSIYLIGHRGSGKTTYGRHLATALRCPFIDLDEVIATRTGRSIEEIFVTDGEALFRTIERDTLSECCRRHDATAMRVVALGAGFPLDTIPLNQMVVWVRRPSDGQPRPLEGRPRLKPTLTEVQEWAVVAAQRHQGYADIATRSWMIGEEESPSSAVARVLMSLPHGVPILHVVAPTMPIRWTGTLSASKSELLRALIIAAQATHAVTIHGTSECDDVALMCQALRQIGVTIYRREMGFHVIPPANGWRATRAAPSSEQTIFAGASGAVLRFLLPLLAKITGTFTVRGTKRLHMRPLAPLIDAMQQLGAHVTCLEGPGCAPLRIVGNAADRDRRALPIDTSVSSQFASALLLSGMELPHGRRLRLPTQIRSHPYLQMTVDLLRTAGIQATEEVVPAHAAVTTRALTVEADASSAAVLLAAGAIAGDVTITNYPCMQRQVDTIFLAHLSEMGALIDIENATVRVRAHALRPFSADVGHAPDLAPLLAVCATFAKGRSHIRGAPHLRWKESDRIHDLALELRRIGVEITTHTDGFTIHGRDRGDLHIPNGVEIDPHDDHRLAMAFALLALHGQPLCMRNPGVVTKSFPEFWLTLVAAGFSVRYLE